MTWQPIETAPRDGTSVLLLFEGVVHQGAYHGPSDGAIFARKPSVYNWFSETCGASLHDADVTHWQPLPPPESEG